jgi:polyferredoxin
MSGQSLTLPQYEGPVLSTLNADGSRRWMTPRVAKGRFWKRRLIVAWLLIAIFTAIPWIRVAGLPLVQLDVVARQFTFVGTVFRPTDTFLLALLFLSVFVGIFLLTAVAGRVWCGWACPQTVYMEFLYRPIERFFLGKAYGKAKAEVPAWRRIAMYATFLVISAHLANTFLAYFVGTDNLVVWTLRSPSEHPVAFAVFAATTGLMLFDFCFFREQLCTIVCPYGRFQSVLLDRDSLIVGYDRQRGEPRGRATRAARTGSPESRAGHEHHDEPGHACKGRNGGTCCGKCRDGQGAAAAAHPATRERGDCVDCGLCVAVCPTGIDIRNGLQLECLHCAQCIDACDGVMAKLGRDPGLIRYGSQNTLEGTPRKRIRFRLFVYPILLLVLVSAFATMLATRKDAMVVQLRSPGETYRVSESGFVDSPLRIRIDNRTREVRTYAVSLAEPHAESLSLAGEASVSIDPAQSEDLVFMVRSDAAGFEGGRRSVELRVTDGARYDERIPVTVIGPFGSLGGVSR